MGGFVASAAAILAERGIQDGDPACVMGYSIDGADMTSVCASSIPALRLAARYHAGSAIPARPACRGRPS